MSMSALRVELFYDTEARNWHYRVPALHINGGGTSTRADAERRPDRLHRAAAQCFEQSHDPNRITRPSRGQSNLSSRFRFVG